MSAQTSAWRHLVHLLRGQWFRRLFSVRVTSQFGDGFFQVGLASYVLFSPEKQPTPGDIATTLAVMLLPFTVVGPFAGVLLDRWPRRQVLAITNLVRLVVVGLLAALVAGGVPDPVFYVVVVASLSLNRFVLSGLSAALPHTVTDDDLVTANALTPTLGSIAALTGGLLGTGVRSLADDAVVFVAAATLYGAAGLLALRIPRMMLGPDFDPALPAVREAVRNVARGLAQGLAHLAERRSPAYALLTIGGSRFLLGVTTVSGLLLLRNEFNPGDEDAALRDISVMIALSAAGFVVAAVLTPIVVERITTRLWILVLLVTSGVAQVFPFTLYTRESVWVSGFFLGLAAQGIKICVDTLVQLGVDDPFRGRVFALYDMLFNLALVGAGALTALVLPDDGRSAGLAVATSLAYLCVAAAYEGAHRTVFRGSAEREPQG